MNEDRSAEMSEEEAMMDNYMSRAGKGDNANLTFKEIKQLRNQEFVQAVKDFLHEPQNKQLDIYLKNLKKNIILGFMCKAEKEVLESITEKSKGGRFLQLAREFVSKTHKDEEFCVKIRDILKKTNKNRNKEKSRKRKMRKRDQQFGNTVDKIRDMQVADRSEGDN